MDEKLADLLDAKEGVDEAAPDANVENKYLKKTKYIRTPHGDLESKSNFLFCLSFLHFQITTLTHLSLVLLFATHQSTPLSMRLQTKSSPMDLFQVELS